MAITWAEIMDGSGTQLFAGPRLTGNEHTGVALSDERNFGHGFAESDAFADQFVETQFFLEPLFRALASALLLDHAHQPGNNIARFQRRGNEIRRAGFEQIENPARVTC